MRKRDLPPVHPGEILLEDFLVPMETTRYRLAKYIGVRQRRIDDIGGSSRNGINRTLSKQARPG